MSKQAIIFTLYTQQTLMYMLFRKIYTINIAHIAKSI